MLSSEGGRLQISNKHCLGLQRHAPINRFIRFYSTVLIFTRVLMKIITHACWTLNSLTPPPPFRTYSAGAKLTLRVYIDFCTLVCFYCIEAVCDVDCLAIKANRHRDLQPTVNACTRAIKIIALQKMNPMTFPRTKNNVWSQSLNRKLSYWLWFLVQL